MQATNFKMKKQNLVPSCNANRTFNSRMIEWLFFSKVMYMMDMDEYIGLHLHSHGPVVFFMGKCYGNKYIAQGAFFYGLIISGLTQRTDV